MGLKNVVKRHLAEEHTDLQTPDGGKLKFERIETPEEVEAWKAERKRRFPSKANVEQKAHSFILSVHNEGKTTARGNSTW